MSKEKALAKNTLVVTIGKISTQFITFLLLPIYTAVLSTEEYGIVDLLTTLVSLLLPIITLQMEQGIFRFLIDCRKNEEEKNKLISTISVSIVIQCTVYVLSFIIFSRFINNDYKYFLLVNVIACVFSTILLQISRGLGDNVRYAKASFLMSVVTILLNILFIVGFKLGAYGMLFAICLGYVICSLYIIFTEKIYKYVHIKLFDFFLLKEVLKYSVPLIPNMISWWIVNVSDRSIITFFIGIGANGIYSAANKFSSIISTIFSVFNMTWTESASLNINEKDSTEFFNKILDFVMRVFGMLCLGIIAFMPFVFPILINEKYSEAYYQIPILILGSMFNILVSFIGSIYVAKKKTKEIAKTSIIAACINIVINIIFIKKIGLYSASISTVLAYGTMFVYRFFDVQKYIRLKFNNKIIISIILLTVLTIAVYYYRKLPLLIINAIFVTVYAIYINRKNMSIIINFIKKKN